MSQQLQPPHDVLDEFHAPDIIQVGLLLATIFGLYVTRGSLREATKARDVENYYKIVSMFEAGFDRFAAANAQNQYVEFSALVNLFESTCDLYNHRLFGKATHRMLRPFLRELIPQLWNNPAATQWLAKAQTDPDTFKEIKTFARQENLAGVPHQ